MNKYKKKIFLTAYGGSHIKTIFPLVKQLNLNNDEFDICLFGTPAALVDIYRYNGIRYVTYLNYVSYANEQIFKHADFVDIINFNHNSSFPISIAETIAYLACNITDYMNMNKMTLDEVVSFFNNYNARQKFYPFEFFKWLFKIIQPDIVVATTSPKTELAVIDAANYSGIISISIDDLLGNHFLSGKPPSASYHFVMSEYVKQNYLKHNIEKEKVLITGNPYFEDFVVNFRKQKFNRIDNNKIITLLYNKVYFDNKTRQIVNFDKNVYLRFLEKLKIYAESRSFRVAIRNHPNLHINERLIIDGFLDFDQYDLDYALFNSDFVIGFDSTVLLQSLLLGIPTIEILIRNLGSSLELHKFKLSPLLSLESTYEQIEKIFYNFPTPKEEDILYLLNIQNATNKIINKIKNIC